MEIQEKKIKLSIGNETFLIDNRCILLEPREVYDQYIIGYDQQEKRIIYSLEQCIEYVMNRDSVNYFSAYEWFDYNIPPNYPYPKFKGNI